MEGPVLTLLLVSANGSLTGPEDILVVVEFRVVSLICLQC